MKNPEFTLFCRLFSWLVWGLWGKELFIGCKMNAGLRKLNQKKRGGTFGDVFLCLLSSSSQTILHKEIPPPLFRAIVSQAQVLLVLICLNKIDGWITGTIIIFLIGQAVLKQPEENSRLIGGESLAFTNDAYCRRLIKTIKLNTF